MGMLDNYHKEMSLNGGRGECQGVGVIFCHCNAREEVR